MMTAAGAAVAAVTSVKESAYAFRERLEIVHEPGRRDFSLQPSKGEFVAADGLVVSVPRDADEALVHAGKTRWEPFRLLVR